MGKIETNSGVFVALDHEARIPLRRQSETSIRAAASTAGECP